MSDMLDEERDIDAFDDLKLAFEIECKTSMTYKSKCLEQIKEIETLKAKLRVAVGLAMKLEHPVPCESSKPMEFLNSKKPKCNCRIGKTLAQIEEEK